MSNITGIVAAKRLFPCKGVVFDKDGTLIDIFPMLEVLARERRKHLSSRVKPEALEIVDRCVGFDPETGRIEPFGPLASAARRDEVAVAACGLWLAGIPWHQAISIAKEAFDDADRTLDVAKGVVLFPGVQECLKNLREKGLRLFVITSDGHQRTERMLSHTGILQFFDLVVAADDVANVKPSPDALQKCAEVSGLSPSDLVVVGDAPQDALMARRAGSRTIGVLTGVGSYESLEGLCDIVIPSVRDISPA